MSVLDFPLSECLSSGLEDFKEQLIHIDCVGQTKLWVMILKWGVCMVKAKICLCELEIFCFSIQHLFCFLLVMASCFFFEKAASPLLAIVLVLSNVVGTYLNLPFCQKISE